MDVDDFVRRHEARLNELADVVVPGDDWPSASRAGATSFLREVLRDRPDWMPRLESLIASPEPEGIETWNWFAGLVSAGYYADPGNGGNRAADSWRMVGWRPEPLGGWPAAPIVSDQRTGLISPEDLLERYDVIVVGSGAGGGVAAAELSTDRRVLVVEAGSWPDARELGFDHIRNARSNWGLLPRSGPSDLGQLRMLENRAGEHPLRPIDEGWGNNAFTVGGGTRVYGAQAWRFSPTDFRMASTYGVPAGSALADWPFGYDELEPYYHRAEWEMGVSGSPAVMPNVGPRSGPYPMPPLPGGVADEVLGRGAASLGIPTVAPPLLINSRPYQGRAACAQCAMCVGFACPVDAKNGSQNTTLARALATGNCSIIVRTRAQRLLMDAAGKVVGVRLVGRTASGVWSRDVFGGQMVLAAGAVESAHLLLNSRSGREPDGVGNNADQVGRHLQGHLYGGATGLFRDDVVDLLGPGPSIATTAYQHGNAGIVGGGMIANEFVPTPSNTYQYLVSAGFLPAFGAGSKSGMRHLARKMMRVMGPIQELTSPDSRVRIDDGAVDEFGTPVVRLSGSVCEEDFRARDFLSERASEWLRASGAEKVAPISGQHSAWAPSSGQHQAGTCRMGDDPAHSVVDPFGRIWGHPNVRVADASVHVTNGGVNPVLTVIATAYRTMDAMRREA